MNKNTDSIIFDLDGTLWDSTATVARAWQAAINKVDFVKEPITQQQVQSITGLQYDVIFEKLFPTLQQEQRHQLKQLCAAEELAYMRQEGGQLYAGLEETLRYLKKKYPLFIVSNCQSGYIEAFLAHHKLQHFFSDCECFGNTLQPKAENLKALIRRNELKSPVYVGDTMGDYEASKSNGIPFIYTRYGFGQVAQPDASINHFNELQKLF